MLRCTSLRGVFGARCSAISRLVHGFAGDLARNLVRNLIRNLIRLFAGHGQAQVLCGESVSFRRPGAEIGQLATLGTERTPGIGFPRRRLTTQGTDHAQNFTMTSEPDDELAGPDLTHRAGLKQPAEAVVIDFRNTDEFDSEFTMLAPTDCGRFDRDGRP